MYISTPGPAVQCSKCLSEDDYHDYHVRKPLEHLTYRQCNKCKHEKLMSTLTFTHHDDQEAYYYTIKKPEKTEQF